jgi:uncharacterized protein YndB with AHSA1/START domain/DNA-binding transcriptional ArsR family regulator
MTGIDEVFRALSDPSRRRLLDSLNARNGQSLQELCAGLDSSRQSVSKHLAILEQANLVTTIRQGRHKLHYLNAAPISDIAERWISRYDQLRIDALTDLKNALENTPMTTASKPAFVYTNYIRTTPERLWQALTDPAFTRRYWGGVALRTDWQQGSGYTLDVGQGKLTVEDPEQIILVSDPYRRLSYTWHTFTPQWAAHYGVDEAHRARIAAEPRSKVTFDLEPAGDLVKLTVLHDGFEPGTAIIDGVSQGWPRILSELKTLLETGDLPG